MPEVMFAQTTPHSDRMVDERPAALVSKPIFPVIFPAGIVRRLRPRLTVRSHRR